MNFILKNFGKIAEADIKLDGITVICGNNDTGKSTVGKALFSFYNSMYDYKTRIAEWKKNEIMKFLKIHVGGLNLHSIQQFYNNDISYFLNNFQENEFTIKEINEYFEKVIDIKLPKDTLLIIEKYLKTPENEILNELVFRYFNNVMNYQLKRANSANSRCIVKAIFREKANELKFTAQKCECNMKEQIAHKAYYINSPFVIDYLNRSIFNISLLPLLERNVIEAIQHAQTEINADSMTNILDSVNNKKELGEIKKILKKAYTGDTQIDNGQYFYVDNGAPYDFRNISAGLKSFALIERLLESGVLKRKDVLILDEPEIHLHSEWQIYYAELIVMLQKQFDLTILLVTHSFQFLESLNFFMKYYEISDRGNYYIPKTTEKGIEMQSCGGDASELKKILTTGSVTLSDLKFNFEMENYHDEEDN